MNVRVPWNAGNFLTSCKPVSFSRRTLHRGVSKLDWRWPVTAETCSQMNVRVPWNAGNFLTSCKPVIFSRRTLHRGVSKNCTVSTKCKVCVDATDSLQYRCYILPLNFSSIIPPLEAKPVKQCTLKLTNIKSGGRYIIYNAKCSVVSVLLSSASCSFRVSVISCTGRTYQVNKSNHSCW